MEDQLDTMTLYLIAYRIGKIKIMCKVLKLLDMLCQWNYIKNRVQ